MKIRPCTLAALIVPLFISNMNAQIETIPLWPEDAIPFNLPHRQQETEEIHDWKVWIFRQVTVPGIQYFPAPKDKANGTAVVICPGGAYMVEAFDHEGVAVAKKLNEWGISAFVLRYRLPNDSTMTNKHRAPLSDALQAIRLVRLNAEKWGLQRDKIGIMGLCRENIAG